METSPHDSWTTVAVDFRVGGTLMHAEITVPEGLVDAGELLPALQRLSDAIVAESAESVERAGHRITCRKGCGACCRQLVPISEPEARHIRDLVRSFPAPRRSQVESRFAEARRRLSETGFLARLEQPEALSQSELASLGTDYFRLGIACPFLEDESCSIHPDRPLACREYLVTSPAANCANPTTRAITGVMFPARVSNALTNLDAKPGARGSRWIPLVLAPDWADAHPAGAPSRTGPEVLRAIFSILARREIVPDPRPGAGLSGQEDALSANPRPP